MSTEKKEVAKIVTMPKEAEKKPTEKALNLAEMLEKQLKEIQRKKKLADNRVFFLTKRTELENCIEILNEEITQGNFSTDRFVLKFGKRSSYRDEEQIFTISNPDVLMKFIISLQGEIDKSVEKIEKDLLQDLA